MNTQNETAVHICIVKNFSFKQVLTRKPASSLNMQKQYPVPIYTFSKQSVEISNYDTKSHQM